MNREKSQARIKELTQLHKEGGAPSKPKPVQRPVENLSESSDSDIEPDGDAVMKDSSSAKKKDFVNKNTVAKSKHQNKRNQKEALKKIKQKRMAGTTSSAAQHPKQNGHSK